MLGYIFLDLSGKTEFFSQYERNGSDRYLGKNTVGKCCGGILPCIWTGTVSQWRSGRSFFRKEAGHAGTGGGGVGKRRLSFCRKYQRNAGDLVYQRTLSGTCMAADGETGCRYDTWKTDRIDCPGVIIYQPGRDAECVSVQCGYVREKGMAV